MVLSFLCNAFLLFSGAIGGEISDCDHQIRRLYPSLKVSRTYQVEVGNSPISVQESGNPNGQPVVLINDKLSGKVIPHHRRFFDPQTYRIIQYSQLSCENRSSKGCSFSIDNDVSDLEELRRYLSLPFWHIFGSSFSSTTALAYAIQFPHRTMDLLLHSTFLSRPSDWNSLYDSKHFEQFPNIRSLFSDLITSNDSTTLDALHQKFEGDQASQDRAALFLQLWMSALISGKDMDLSPTRLPAISKAQLRRFKIFDAHQYRLARESPLELLPLLHRLQDIPIAIVQGAEDHLSPSGTTIEIDRYAPVLQVFIVPGVGHSISVPKLESALRSAADSFRSHFSTRVSASR